MSDPATPRMRFLAQHAVCGGVTVGGRDEHPDGAPTQTITCRCGAAYVEVIDDAARAPQLFELTDLAGLPRARVLTLLRSPAGQAELQRLLMACPAVVARQLGEVDRARAAETKR